MANTTSIANARALRALRSKAALFDELVEQLAHVEDEFERARSELRQVRRAAARDGIDPTWRALANELASVVRPLSGCFGEQRVEDGRIVVHVRVSGALASQAHEALERLARQVAVESYREHGGPVREDDEAVAGEREAHAA